MVSDEFGRHLETLYACRACPNVIGEPVTGAVADARVMLVGQAPGPHEVEDRRPFAYTAGRRLFSWFAQFGVSEELFRAHVHIAAVIRCFPGKDEKAGGDRVPSPEEIARCGEHLDREIAILKPKLVIAVGTLASATLIGIAQLKDAVGRVHRVTWRGSSDPRERRVGEPAPRFDVVVLPHPSGRSTWLNKKENAAMLDESLRLIREHPAWKKTFGGQ
jgi:uracil-DNA glycosylase